MLKWFGCGRCDCRVVFLWVCFVLPFFDCWFWLGYFFMSGGVASSTPQLFHTASPACGTALCWDTQRNSSFPGVFRMICFSVGSVEWKGFGAAIESTSLPSSRINNPLSLVMDASLSCSARIPSPCGQLFQPALCDRDQG